MEAFYKQTAYGIPIVATSLGEIKKVRSAMRLIKKNSSALFNNVLKINAVLIYPEKGYDNVMLPEHGIWVVKSATVDGQSLKLFSSLIVHEAEHIVQFESRKRLTANQMEKGAYEVQKKFLTNVRAGDYEIEWLDEQFRSKWWVFEDKAGNKSTTPPTLGKFEKFAEDYLAENLKFKK